jgi:regulator of sigma D
MENQIIKEGYAIYETNENSYIDSEGDYTEIENAQLFPALENAVKDIQDYWDEPDNTEIHEIKMVIDIKNKYSRKITYELIKTEE